MSSRCHNMQSRVTTNNPIRSHSYALSMASDRFIIVAISFATVVSRTSSFQIPPNSFIPCSSSSIVQMSEKGPTAIQDWDVDRYQKQHNFVWEFGSPLIDLLDPQPGQTVLDVGCGTGELTKAIAERGATAFGFDADPSMVEKAKAQFKDIHFFQAYAQDFKMEDGPVDAIFSNAALHWVSDPEGAIAAMSKALKPGGKFVVEFGGKGNVQQLTTTMLEATGKSPTDSPWYFPSIAEYSGLLEKHGIEVTSAALFDRPTLLDDGAEGLSNWFRMFGISFLRDLNDIQVTEALAQVNDKLRPLLFDGEQWTADYRRIRIVGKKLE